MEMYIEDLIALFLIFAVVLCLGLRATEQGVNYMMGLDVDPLTFDMKVLPEGNYYFCVLGQRFSFKKILELGEFYADRRRIDIRIASFDISVPTMVQLYTPSKPPRLRFFLDK
ncbi:MAG: hypothetical protein PWP45_228 [Tepidanaerobacteraceae bacterium]|nr:hypothetical protein [Tepidanaerobacteraceae bacterium]